MAFHSAKHKTTYVSVPKCACTSLKMFMFQLENGRPFRGFTVNGKKFGIHNFVGSEPFFELPQKEIAGHKKFTVVRGPVSRMRSCYESKVLLRKALEKKNVALALDAIGVTKTPTFAEFIEHLDVYRRASGMIRQHSLPLEHYLGADPEWYDRIFAFSEIGQVSDWVEEQSGVKARVRHANKGKKRLDAGAMTPELEARIHEKFASDFTLYGKWLDQPA